MGGWNIEDYTYKSNLMSREGIIIPGKPNFSLLEGEAMTLKDNGSYDWGLVGAFYRVSYSYKGKYLPKPAAVTTVTPSSRPTSVGDSSPRVRWDGASRKRTS